MSEAPASTARGLGGLRRYFDFVKFEHTLFALPFAYVGMLLGADGWPGWADFGWITLAMVGARTAAMAINRVVDARIDALNPRTKGREIPSGRLTRGDGVALAVAGTAALLLAGWALDPLAFRLAPLALLFLALYPYTKRVTWACHLWLGTTIGAAGAGGWIAVTGAFAPEAWALWIGLGAWIAGFDVIYALLDVRFDREHGVHSLPADLGETAALRISAALHLVSLAGLALLGRYAGLGLAYGIALAGVAAAIVYQQVRARTLEPAAVLRGFNANLWVSSLLLLGVVADVALN